MRSNCIGVFSFGAFSLGAFSLGAVALIAASLLTTTVATVPAAAEGALALDVPADVAHDGFSYGTAHDRATAEEARSIALNGCRTNKDGSKKSQALCRIFDTFHNQCVAVALDPKAGTPGVGWAIAVDQATADRQALANCVLTAGPTRKGSCVVNTQRCDGTAAQ